MLCFYLLITPCLQWCLMSPSLLCSDAACAGQARAAQSQASPHPAPSHLFHSVWSCALGSENYDKSWSLLHCSAKFLHRVAFWVQGDGDVFMNHGCLFTQRDPYDCCRSLCKRLIESSAFVCVSCVLYLSNNANGNEYQNCDFGEGGHREDCFGRKIPERWVPWPHCTPGHNCGILRIKVLRLEQLCFWQTNFFVLSCRTLDIDGREVKLGVWDTAGSERYDTITRMYYR